MPERGRPPDEQLSAAARPREMQFDAEGDTGAYRILPAGDTAIVIEFGDLHRSKYSTRKSWHWLIA